MDKKRIIKVAICSFISAIIWCTVSKCFASTDTMSTEFQNISKESWLMITDYLYDNIEDISLRSKLQPITTSGEYSTQMYTTLKTYLNNVTVTSNDATMIRRYKYAHSDLSRLTFIAYDNRIYIYSSEIWKRKSGTSDYTLDSYEVVDTASYTFSTNTLKFYGDTSNNTLFANNRDYIYIDLTNYTIYNGLGNYSNLGANLTMSRYTVTQNADLSVWSYGSNSDTTMIVQFAGSGAQGNPTISYYLKDYLSSSSTLYPMLLKNAVYLDGSENTGGSTGGNTGEDTGGGSTGGGTGGGSVDLEQVEEELGNISDGLNNPDSTLNNNLNDIENAINGAVNNPPTTTENDFAESFPTVEIDDPSEDFFTWIFENIENIFLSTEEQEFQFSLYTDTVYTVSSNQLNVPDSAIKTLVGLSIDFGICYWILKDVRKTINKVKEGNIEALADEDITANMV